MLFSFIIMEFIYYNVNYTGDNQLSDLAAAPLYHSKKPVLAGALRLCAGISTASSTGFHAINTRSSVSGTGSIKKLCVLCINIRLKSNEIIWIVLHQWQPVYHKFICFPPGKSQLT